MPIKRIASLKDYQGAFITVAQAADYLNASPKFIRSQIKKGALPARHYGEELRILTPDFQQYVYNAGSTDLDPSMRRS